MIFGRVPFASGIPVTFSLPVNTISVRCTQSSVTVTFPSEGMLHVEQKANPDMVAYCPDSQFVQASSPVVLPETPYFPMGQLDGHPANSVVLLVKSPNFPAGHKVQLFGGDG
jgi:hypothetical protein